MDSISHVAVGAGIAIAATLVPEVANSTHYAAIVGFSIGFSVLPDIDVVVRPFVGPRKFLQIHRGVTHSLFLLIPAMLLLSYGVSHLIDDVSTHTIMIIMMLAGLSHVTGDLTNNYGIAIGWPFRRKWFRLSITNTSDSFVLVTHFIGFVIFLMFRGFDIPNAWIAFIVIYSLTIIYWIVLFSLKALAHAFVYKHYVKKTDVKRIYILSKTNAWQWKYIVETKNKYLCGYVKGKTIEEITYASHSKVLPKWITSILQDSKEYRNFTNFSPIWTIKMDHYKGKHAVYIKDLRYFDKKGQFYFYINLLYDRNGVSKSVLTWTKSSEKRKKKIYAS